jgi:nucleoside-diphosphate-sugar epimerase
MQRILITGITGFVGSSLVNHFRNVNNYLLFGHSRYGMRAQRQFESLKVEFIEDVSAARLNALGIDCVIHLAGIAHDLSNRFQPNEYYQVNEHNTKRVYDEFLRSTSSKFIFLSSIKAVADATHDLVTEENTPRPDTDYGKSKLNAEVYIQSKVNYTEKRVYIFRPCMIHGPGNKGNLNLLYRFVKLGIPYPLGAFENQRSFLSIDNFSFIVQKFLDQDMPSGIYNLADEGSISTKELYRLIAGSIGKRTIILNIPRSLVSLLANLAGKKNTLSKLTENMMISNEKLLRTLDSKLPVALRDGISKTIQSFRE